MFGQTFHLADLGVVGVLVMLEALLSADNALVLAIMVRHLPRELQKRALLYGLGGAFLFRLGAILLASHIIAFWWLQAIGAIYLLYLPIKHFIKQGSGKEVQAKAHGFWQTVALVELADIAFAIDSVLAGVAMVHRQDKVWVVYAGAVIGVVLLRFAASFFIRLLERYPDLDHTAYLLVGWVGVKLAFLASHNYGVAQHAAEPTPMLPSSVFWCGLAAIALFGSFFAVRRQQIRAIASENAEFVDTFDDVFESPPETEPTRS